MSAPLRVLALAESVAPTNGWGTYTANVAALLRTDGAQVTLLTADAESPFCLPSALASRVNWWIAEIRFRRWLRRHRAEFDVIHVMVEPYARLFRSFQNLPFIITLHGSFANPSMHGSGAALFARALKKASRLIAVSAFTHRQLPADIQSRTAIIQNGIDPTIATESATEPPTHGHPLVLSVGVLKPRKGFESLIAGFALYVQSHPQAELVIIGPDPAYYRPTLDRAIQNAGLTGRVRILGEVSRAELLGWYRACDVFALTPTNQGGFEGFGLVYLEAAAFGKPSVGTRDSGASEAIAEGISGILCNPSAPQEIAETLTQASALPADVIRAHAATQSWSTRAISYKKLLTSVASTRA